MILLGFEQSTRLLSGRTYQTLALGKMITDGLKHFLTRHQSVEPMVNFIKKTLLLTKLEDYCEEIYSSEAKDAIIASI
jgi:hypothetical protein